MNEVFKPNMAERVAPATTGAADVRAPDDEPDAAPRRRGAAASLRPDRARRRAWRSRRLFAWQKFEKPGAVDRARAPSAAASGPPPQTVRVAAVALGRHADHHRRARHGHAARDRDDPHPDRRQADGGRLQRRPDRQEGRLPRPDRSAPLSGGARPGAGPTRQGPGAATRRRRADLARYETLEQAGFDRQAAGRRPAVRWSRRTRRRSRPTRRRSTDGQAQHRLYATSSRRSPAASACGWSTRAITAGLRRRPASSSSPRSTRSASSSRRRRTICRASRRG